MDDHVPSQNVETPTKKAGNVCSRLCHCLMIFPLLTVAVLASVSLAFFVDKQNEIIAANANNQCILYATQGEPPSLHDDTGCNIAIWGEVSLIVLGVILLIWMVIKAVLGVHVLKGLVFIDLFGFGVGFLSSVGFALNITVGLARTCNALGQEPSDKGSCSKFGITFYDSLHISEVTAWLAAAVLFLMFVVYIFLTIAYCCRHALREKGPKYSSFHDVAALRQSKKSPFHSNYGTTGTATERTTKSTNPFNDS